MMLFHRLKLKI